MSQRRTPFRLALNTPDGDEIVRRDYYTFHTENDILGRGMSSIVFKAQCKQTKEYVALKRIPKYKKNLNSIVRQEWQTNKMITNTSHVVSFLQLIETEAYIYFVQELMGDELFDAIINANPGGVTEDQARDATRR